MEIPRCHQFVISVEAPRTSAVINKRCVIDDPLFVASLDRTVRQTVTQCGLLHLRLWLPESTFAILLCPHLQSTKLGER